jgi:nucleotide-binding universal stress UspA family protein
MARIIVGVDGSGGATHALRWAAEEALIRDADLIAVLAWGYLNQYPSDATTAFRADYSDADALAALDAIVAASLEADAARSVQRRVVCDLPTRALLDASDDGDLLVVGARGLGGFRGLLLGSVSQHCLHHATVPTVIVRDLRPGVIGRVVVGIDGSKQADAALEWAVEEARRRQATLTVVHAYPPPVAGGPFSALRIDQSMLADAAGRVLNASISGIDTTAVDVAPLVVCGSAAGAVVDAGDDADLVVVGSRGRGPVKRLLLGSVATQVVHHARVPVAVVPIQKPDR